MERFYRSLSARGLLSSTFVHLAAVLSFGAFSPAALMAAAPTIGSIDDLTIQENGATGALAFSVSDAETAATSLSLDASSSETGLVNDSGIDLGGSGESRTVTVTPKSNVSGEAVITITVEDEDGDTASESFTVKVNAPPTVSKDVGGNETIDEDNSTGALGFTVGDDETSEGSLGFSAVVSSSSNANLLPSGSVVTGGSGANRTVTITPAPDENGTATITVTTTDSDGGSASVSFDLTVDPVNDQPTLAGSLLGPSGSPLPDDQPGAALFGTIVLDDVDQGRPSNESLTVTLTFGGDFGSVGAIQGYDTGVIELTGTPGTVTAAIQALLFDPLPNLVPVGESGSFTVTIDVTDIANVGAVNNGEVRTVYVISENDAPTVVASVDPASTTDSRDVRPFRLTVSDPDPGDETGGFTVAVVAVSDPGFALGQLVPASPSFTGSKQEVESGVRTVVYRPTPNAVAGSTTVDLKLSATDPHGVASEGTVTLTIVGDNDPPDIIGVAANTLRLTDDPAQTALVPFEGVTISDPDDNGAQAQTVTLSVADASYGTLSATTLAGTPDEVTTALRAVTFMPVQRLDRVLNETVQTTLVITVTDDLGAARVNSDTRLSITSVDGAPDFVGLPADPPLQLAPVAPVLPFAAVSVTDDGDGEVTLTVALDDPDKGTFREGSRGDFVEVTAGSFELTATVDVLTTALQGLEFEVSETYVFAPNAPGGTDFLLVAVDTELNTTERTLSVVLQNDPRNHLVVLDTDEVYPPDHPVVEERGQPMLGTLRRAVLEAGNNDFITFDLPQYPALIRLDETLGSLELRSNLTLKGPGADLLEISGDSGGDGVPDTQLFQVHAVVTLEGLTLTKGTATSGGAIYVGSGGELTLSYCALSHCRATQWGGAIDVEDGSLEVSHCLFRANETDASLGLGGGAVSIFSTEPSSFENVTFSANRQASATGFGGGALYAEISEVDASLVVEVSHCTFAENEDVADRGSSIAVNVLNTVLTVRNSVFADGRGRNLEVQGAGRIESEGGNVSDDSTRAILTQAGIPKDIIILDQDSDLTQAVGTLLGAYDDLRSPMPGYPLTANSPAVGRALTPVPPTDQLGALRDADPDAGALEFEASARIVLNEIQFSDAPADFLEFYVLRDSVPVTLDAYTVWVDGEIRHVFPSNTEVRPGEGVIVADTLIAALGGTPVQTPTGGTGSELALGARGVVELRTPGTNGRVIARSAYLGVYADPNDPDTELAIGDQSITLNPQFRGFALVPHPTDDNSPGADSNGTPFGSPNAFPSAQPDAFIVSEDDRVPLDLLANDVDADGSDVLEIIDLSSALEIYGNDGTAQSTLGARLLLNPVSAPPAGDTVWYDPRKVPALQELPAGYERTDTFAYAVIDTGTGPIWEYQSSSGGADTAVLSPNHRLASGQSVLIAGAGVLAYNGPHTVTVVDADRFSIGVAFDGDPDEKGDWRTVLELATGAITGYASQAATLGTDPVIVTSVAHGLADNDGVIISGSDVVEYDGPHVITRIDDDQFSIPTIFLGDPVTKGGWSATRSRVPTKRSEVLATVTVLGANDPPGPVDDLVADAEEETILRILGDSPLLGSTTVFDTDNEYAQVPVLSAVNLLANDDDVDTDDTGGSLLVVGVLPGVSGIDGYAGIPGETPVTVTSLAHGLEDGQTILVSGYGGHPSYNGFHPVTVIDEDTFTLPLLFVDDAAVKGEWGLLTDDSRLETVSEMGAEVRLEIRVDRRETSIVYDPLGSSDLDALADGQTGNDTFYYAVEDSHGAVAFAAVSVAVAGRNDPPVPVADPPSLGELPDDQPLPDILGAAEVEFYLPPASGVSGRADLTVTIGDDSYLLADLWTTDEATAIFILTSDLLANDTDVDGSETDRLVIGAVDSTSAGQAAVTLSADGSVITYDPAASDVLDALAREEPYLDTFAVRVVDPVGSEVETTVAVLVTGLNDTPIAADDAVETDEDSVVAVDPRVNDSELDINGVPPDNQLRLIPAATTLTGRGAEVTITPEELIYDPTVSSYLNALVPDWREVEVIPYTVADGSLVFANDDAFKVAADGSDYALDVLANDRNLAGAGGSLTLIEVGAPNRGGAVAIVDGGTRLAYSPEVNYVGDEVFTYTVSDENGNIDQGLVVVRATVNQLNGNLQANDDFFSVAKGQSPTLAVLANDNLLPAPGEGLVITRVVDEPLRDRVVLTDNALVYAQEDTGPFPYETTFTYEVSGGGTARAIATVRVRVENRELTLDLRADTFSVLGDSADNSLDVLANDNILPGTPVVLEVTGIVTPPQHGSAEIGPDGSSLLYTPEAGFVGRDQLTYLAGDGFGGTGETGVAIIVGSLSAAGDFFAIPFDDPAETDDDDRVTTLDVLANDRLLAANPLTLELANVVALPSPDGVLGTMRVSGDFLSLEFDPASGAEGEQEFRYTVRDDSTPSRTASAIVVVRVVAEGVRANADVYAVEVGSQDNRLEVLANDVAVPDRGRRLSVVSVGEGLDAPDRGGAVRVSDAGDALIYSPAPDFSGEETFTYTMTDSRGTDTTEVIVRVSSGEIFANNDAYTVFYSVDEVTGDPISFTLPVIANDRVLPDFGQLLAITGVGIDDGFEPNAPTFGGDVEISPDGTALIYTPREDPGLTPDLLYAEAFTYEINDGTARRAQGRVRVEVQERTGVRDMQTEDDAFSVERDSEGNILPVLANDDVKPAGAAGWVITEVTPAQHRGVVEIDGRELRYTPQPGFVGTDSFTYFVSDGVGGTGSALVSVRVGELPLCPDWFTALSDSIDNELDVLANDAIRPEDSAGFRLSGVTSPDVGGSASVDPAGGALLYTPDPLYAGTYPYVERFNYEVEDDSGMTVSAEVAVKVYAEGSDRDTANVTVEVVGLNDAPLILGTRCCLEVYHQGTLRPFAGVSFVEYDAVPDPQVLTLVITVDEPTHGLLTNAAGEDLDPDDDGVYVFMGTDAELTALVRGLAFVPTTGEPPRIGPGVDEETRLTLSLFDGYVTVVDDTTTVIARFPEITRLTAADGSAADEFGFSVGASRSVVTAGSPFDDDALIQGSGNKTGAAYVYGRDVEGEDAWGQVAKLVAQLREIGDEFGFATDVNQDGGVLLFGARRALSDGVTTGAAYIFRRNAEGEWEQAARLPADGLTSGDAFGFDVALNAAGDVAVVGAPQHKPSGSARSGAAFVFRRADDSPEAWEQVAVLQPDDGATDDEFARSVSIHGDLIAVGSPRHTPGSKKSGAVYLHRLEASDPDGWTLLAKLEPDAGDHGDEFGHSVAVHGAWLAAGARLDEANGKKSGTTYVFEQDAFDPTVWTQTALLQSEDPADDDEYGFAVGLDSQFLVVGARRDETSGRRAGSLYIHGRDEGGPGAWGLLERVIPSSVDLDDEFGFSVAIRQGLVAVGARRQEADGRRFGATYVYQLRFNNPPSLVEELPAAVAYIEEDFEYLVPAEAFADPDVGDAIVAYTATLDDGEPLPAWLALESDTGRFFSVTPPTPFDEAILQIEVTALDQDGVGASGVFALSVEYAPTFAPGDVATPSAALAWSLEHVALGMVPATADKSTVLGAQGDPDGDGRNNLEEYALMSNPYLPDAGAGVGYAELAVSADGGLELRYLRRSDDPRLACVVESSDDLSGWVPAAMAGTETVTPLSDKVEEARWSLAPTDGASSRFFRVRVDYR